MMKRLFAAIFAVTALAAVGFAVYYAIANQRINQVQQQVASGSRVRFTGPPPPFCVCHSKSPAIRRMHRAFGLADCALCHHGNMMGQQQRKKPTKKDLTHRMRTSPICRQCHRHKQPVR